MFKANDPRMGHGYLENEFEPIARGISVTTGHRVSVYGGEMTVRVTWLDVEKAGAGEATNLFWLRQHVATCLALYNPGIYLLDADWPQVAAEGASHFTQISADKFEWTGDCDLVFEPHPTPIRVAEATQWGHEL